MKIIKDPVEMQRYAQLIKLQGKKIGFVPTMGYLHEGHLSLVREARKRADCVVVSIFVNPTQFAPSEDLDVYPRDFPRDEALLRETGADVIFYPDSESMYPHGFETFVTVEHLSRKLCGISRPTHFRGVATVVAKLFNLVKPDIAVFGEKDFQQLVIIRRMVKDLNFDIDIVGHPTVREEDGLAMSSRNTYLMPEDRAAATLIKKALDNARQHYEKGVRHASILIEKATEVLRQSPKIRIDYLKICDTQSLEDVEEITGEAVMAVAVFIGTTRLIDNMVFSGNA